MYLEVVKKIFYSYNKKNSHKGYVMFFLEEI